MQFGKQLHELCIRRKVIAQAKLIAIYPYKCYYLPKFHHNSCDYMLMSQPYARSNEAAIVLAERPWWVRLTTRLPLYCQLGQGW